MFYKQSEAGFKTVMEGIRLKTLAYGEKTHLTEFRLAEGTMVPEHSHPHEQTGYLISGHMRFQIAGETVEAEPGDGWNIAGGVAHAAEILKDSVVIEIFSPVREDYLP